MSLEPSPAQSRDAAECWRCSADAGNRSFGASWAAYQQRLRAFPVVGEWWEPSLQTQCAGWPFPVLPWPLRRVSGSLEMSGHLYETVAPYQWTLQMQSPISGKVFTVDDDTHGAAMFVESCASDAIAYFDAGASQTRQCPDFPGAHQHRAAAGRMRRAGTPRAGYSPPAGYLLSLYRVRSSLHCWRCGCRPSQSSRFPRYPSRSQCAGSRSSTIPLAVSHVLSDSVAQQPTKGVSRIAAPISTATSLISSALTFTTSGCGRGLGASPR
jgi:hypothetical protein